MAQPRSRFAVRRATLADLDILVAQRVGMYRGMFPKSGIDYTAYGRRYKSWARKLIKQKKIVSFLVETRTGKVVAGGSVWVRENNPSPRYSGNTVPYLMSMYTDPDYRRRGLATLIVKEALKWCRSNGYPRVTLHASPMGEPVYAKLGFERTTEMRLILKRPPTNLTDPATKVRRR